MKKISKKLIALTLALAFALSLFVSGGVTEAAVKTLKTSVNCDKNNYKKLPKLSVGSTRVTFCSTKSKQDTGVQFVAPSAGTYKFTVMSVKATDSALKNVSINGHIGIWTTDKGYFGLRDVSTAYGKSAFLKLCNARFYNSFYRNGKDSPNSVNSPLKSRSFAVKLKKGQTLYFGSYWIVSGEKNGKYVGQKSASAIFKVEKIK